MTSRKILHVDMDAFYASVEQRDHPELRGLPVIVGGQPGRRGVVAACSYEARRFGVHSAMPSTRAARLCPEAVFLTPRFDVYREVSREIHAIFHAFTDRVEPLSLDEAYIDVSDVQRLEGSATRLAAEIKRRIRSATRLTATAGVSYNKFLAKLASTMNKPDGLTVILPEQGEAVVARLPIGQFHGVGRVTEQKMHALGIYCGADLRERSLEDLENHFGRSAAYYHGIARGIDTREVEHRRQRKSIGSETTFQTDLRDCSDMLATLERLGREVDESLHQSGLAARTVAIKVRYADFTSVTRRYTPANPLRSVEDVNAWLPELLARTEASERPVRLLGVSVSGLSPAGIAGVEQLCLL